MILIIDNYDSFTYNLFQLVGGIEPDIKVIRNDELTVEEIDALDPQAIIISPGPGFPKDAGVTVDIVKPLGSRIPILGVCLGHQGICEAFGATVSYAHQVVHGKSYPAHVDTNSVLFRGLNEQENVARYHSLAAIDSTLPPELKVTSTCTDDGEVMAIQHEKYPIYGVQFHPESIMTPGGETMMRNFISAAREWNKLHERGQKTRQ